MNNEENNTFEQENQEVQVVEVPSKKKKDRIFVILAVIVFIITVGLLFMLVTKTGDGQSTVFQRVFNLDMSKLDKERKQEEKEKTPEEQQTEEQNVAPQVEEKKDESDKTKDKKDTSKNNSSSSKPSGSNSSSNKPSGNQSGNSGSSSSSVDSKFKVTHYAYIHKDDLGNINAGHELNRGDVARMISEINHLDINKNYDTNAFADYDKFPDEYKKHILAGYYAGYWSGYGTEENRLFKYDKKVTRNVALVFLFRVIELNKLPVEEKCKQINFTDLKNPNGTPLDQESIDRIHKASRMCLIYGDTGTTNFSPNNTITKLQFVTMLSRAYGRENSKNECDSFPSSSPFADIKNTNSLNYYRLVDAYMTRKCTK